jgi:hypothetical protein
MFVLEHPLVNAMWAFDRSQTKFVTSLQHFWGRIPSLFALRRNQTGYLNLRSPYPDPFIVRKCRFRETGAGTALILVSRSPHAEAAKDSGRVACMGVMDGLRCGCCRTWLRKPGRSGGGAPLPCTADQPKADPPPRGEGKSDRNNPSPASRHQRKRRPAVVDTVCC